PLPSRSRAIQRMTWAKHAQQLRAQSPPYFRAKDIPHRLEDTVNYMSIRSRNQVRTLFLASSASTKNPSLHSFTPPPIRIVNDVDGDVTPPWEFHYSNVMWHHKHVPKPNRKDRVACNCIGECGTDGSCACLQLQRKWTKTWGIEDFAYTPNKRLINFMQPVFECNELCGCDETCRNRVVQQGRRMALTLKKTKGKGWGVFNGPKKIKKGEFVGIYSGELLAEREAHRRGKKYNRFGRTYLFDLDFCAQAVADEDAPDWEPLYTVDAYHAGNFTRFFNHGCDPNLKMVGVYVNEANLDKPFVAFFACRDIKPEEELTFNYRGSDDDDEDGGDSGEPSIIPSDEVYAKCLCGAWNCKGGCCVWVFQRRGQSREMLTRSTGKMFNDK
ncbi:hypothetical protein HDZ31DRAFT_45069, partial [Schizophyllum fasciatum]